MTDTELILRSILALVEGQKLIASELQNLRLVKDGDGGIYGIETPDGLASMLEDLRVVDGVEGSRWRWERMRVDGRKQDVEVRYDLLEDLIEKRLEGK